MYSFSYLEPVCCSMSSSNCCFLLETANSNSNEQHSGTQFLVLILVLLTKEPNFLEQMAESMSETRTVQRTVQSLSIRFEGPNGKVIIN